MLLYAPQGKNKVGGKMKLVLSLLLPFALICNVLAQDADVLYCLESESAGFSGSDRNYALVNWTPGRFTVKFDQGWKNVPNVGSPTEDYESAKFEGDLYESDTELNFHLSNCRKIAVWINCNLGIDGKLLLNIDSLRFSTTKLSPFGFITENTNYTSITSIGKCSKF